MTYKANFLFACAMLSCGQTFADTISLLGDQDFADGTIVALDSEWLSAQSNESLPTTAIYSAPTTIAYFHTGLNPGVSGVLTFSLWDLNSSVSGNQVIDFRLDNIAQPIGGFETGEPDLSIKFFQFPVAGSMLADGEVQVAIILGGPTNNSVGIDFSRLEVVPEPSGLAPLILSSLLGLRFLRRSLARRR
jgi:hypothetical protein